MIQKRRISVFLKKQAEILRGKGRFVWHIIFLGDKMAVCLGCMTEIHTKNTDYSLTSLSGFLRCVSSLHVHHIFECLLIIKPSKLQSAKSKK